MNEAQFTPKQALDVLKNLGALESLKLNIHEHAAIQKALNVIGELVAAQEATKKDELKVV